MLCAVSSSARLQQQKKTNPVTLAPPTASPAPTPALKRSTTRHETRHLGYGGTLTVYGAPEGAINIEGWTQNEFALDADTELRADTEEDLARLATLNSFLLDDDFNHIRLITTGTHDRAFMKRVAKDFPKRLLGLPWRLDYRVRTPASTDLEIYAGRGALSISGVEGSLRLNAGESDAKLVFTGGDTEATIQRGTLLVRLAQRNWRGRGANFRLGTGDLTVELPPGYNGDIDAEVLRTGRIDNSYAALVPRERTHPSERSLQARAGTGGVLLSFTLGDGTLRIKQSGGTR